MTIVCIGLAIVCIAATVVGGAVAETRRARIRARLERMLFDADILGAQASK